MKKTRRTARVGEMLRDALVQVFRSDLRDVSLGLASITDVSVSPDLHQARVFISSLDEKQARQAVAELQKARGQVRHHLGRRIHLRFTPELEFVYDETPLRASRIEDILQQVKPAAGTSEDHDHTTDDHEEDDES